MAAEKMRHKDHSFASLHEGAGALPIGGSCNRLGNWKVICSFF